jgi:hypothetical protein
MSTNSPFEVPLIDLTPEVRAMTPPEQFELAAFGQLLDWRLTQFLGSEGWALVRLSFTWEEDQVLMVLKVRVADIPYVVFVSRQSPIGCVRTLVRKMRAGSVGLYPDKYS